MDQRIIELYDEYTHRPLTRDQFLKNLISLTGSLAAAYSILPLLEGNYASAETVEENDLHTERVEYETKFGKMKGYLAKPKTGEKLPAVMVIHENRGLNAHIEDVARRAASAGFLALAPDGLSSLGGTPANEDEARQLFQQLVAGENTERFAAAVPYLRERPDCTGSVGAVGFCWGGAMSNQLAVNAPDLKAAVAFYGRQPAVAEAAKIKAAVQLHYAALDERVNAGMKEYEQALKDNGIRYEQYVYEGVQHAFHNDTSAARYNKEAATLSWSRTLAFFNKYLRS
ncbi:dienelactone hydrolase family protein [Flavihumibacter sp. UBA7668]|uniref:dienelactone hydrolase family protein n=1 Tax=Flavihumibacter sp. UBA7668 TaxID=1946542 RepID=UPI0025BEB578|nr:dienelactone hydrolase family protein [Flavihumibacter sp. UBA7668]